LAIHLLPHGEITATPGDAGIGGDSDLATGHQQNELTLVSFGMRGTVSDHQSASFIMATSASLI